MDWIAPYISSIFASAVCTAMVMFAFTRRRDGTRRMIFAVGAIIVVPAIVIVAAVQQPYYSTELPAGQMLIVVPVWLAVVAAIFVAGMGWMGFAKRVGDHPYCRKCGFDLFGKPESSTRCSECGAELEAKKAVVIGILVRRYRLIAASLFLFFLGVLIAGKPVYQWAQQVPWQSYKPMWWLVRDLSGPNSRVAEQEISRRFSEREISVRQIKSLIDYAVTHPRKSRNVDFIMGASLDWIDTHDDLNEADCRRLIQLANGYSIAFVVSKLSRGVPIPIRTGMLGDYVGKGNFAGTSNKLQIQLAGIDLGAPTDRDDENTRHVDPGALWPKIPDGPAVLVVKNEAAVHFRSHGKEFIESVTATVNCPTNVATGAASEAPATRPTPADLAVTWQATFGQPRGIQDPSRGLSIECSGAPTRVLAHVILIDSAGRQDIGLVDGRASYCDFTAAKAFRQPVGKAHLELVPAPEMTRDAWDQSPILDQTIKIDQVTAE